MVSEAMKLVSESDIMMSEAGKVERERERD